MGFEYGLEKSETIFKRKFRWLFKIPNISADGVNSLPPSKGSRPSLNFKELEVQGLNESIFLPGKADWRVINLTLYDLASKKHPVFDWVKRLYNPEKDEWNYAVSGDSNSFIIPFANLELYDGAGCLIEQWKFETVWPQSIEFGDLDMSNSDVVVVDISLRYARSYVVEN